MKKLLIPVIALLGCLIFACNSSDKKHKHGEDTGASDESLVKEIDDLHIKGMSKMARLTTLQQQARKTADSLGMLPGGPSGAVATYKQQLDSLLKDLDYAEFAMDKWMPEFYGNPDTLSDNQEERMKYLNNEKIKVTKITDAILGGIQKADSLLKIKW